ncbi:PREDICTED: uncharacterized protein LOC106292443 [Brassica oleracea var. oleracea]|uniref:uncharacterized protein LOC106292443 n=1 Tax=Brassica oleracea var. oleracea TaxID=109376 RepID=UPI0006A6DD47|nr:PREDICTED: uncharacterized protein LOC106292443 [Brassica oleracea var. oleracea]
MLLSMDMMVTIPPSWLRPPPDPPPPSFLGLMHHCSSSLKMMVTALPPHSQPRPPSNPARNKHLPIETPPVKPPEPPDPPDVSVSLVLFTSSSPSPQANQVLDLMFNFSRVSSKLSDDGVVLVFTGDTIFVNWRSSPVDAMLDVWVTLDLWFLALFGSVLMDSVSFGYIFVPLSGFYVALMQLSTAVCSPIIVFNLLKETIIVICCLVNMVMAGIDCPLGSCLEQSLFPIFPHVWSELDEHVWLVLQGFSSRLTLFPAFSAVVVTLRVTRDAIVQETHETVVMRFLMFTCCDLYFHSILGLSVSYSIGLFVALLYSPFMESKLF